MTKSEKSFSSWFFFHCVVQVRQPQRSTRFLREMQYSSAKEDLIYLPPWGRIPGLDGGLRLRISLPLPRQIRLISPAVSPVSWSTPPSLMAILATGIGSTVPEKQMALLSLL